MNHGTTVLSRRSLAAATPVVLTALCLACQEGPTDLTVPSPRSSLNTAAATYVLSLLTAGPSVDDVVLNWASRINGDCSGDVVGIVEPGTYDLLNEIVVNSCSAAVTLQPDPPGTVTVVQRGTGPSSNPIAFNGFHVESANVTIQGFTVESTGQPGEATGPYGGPACDSRV